MNKDLLILVAAGLLLSLCSCYLFQKAESVKPN